MMRDELEALGERLNEELGREYFLTGAGLKQTPEFQSIYSRYNALYTDEAVAAAKRSGDAELFEWVVDTRVGRKAAPFDEQQLAWEQQAVLQVDGREVPYLRAVIELSNSPDRKFRNALDAERARVGALGLDRIRARRFAIERDEVSALVPAGDYVDAMTRLTGIDLDGLGRSAAEFLRDSDDMYGDSLARLVKRRFGDKPGELRRADVAWLFRADEYDRAFEQENMLETARSQMREMGLDVFQSGRIRFDTEERSGKQPRAFCAPVRVPAEVYVVLRPHGGHGDYRAFWHELGHAMHFASVDPERPFADRWLGDNSVTEGFAMLWDHFTMNPAWLSRYTDLPSKAVKTLEFELAVGELYLVRRYAAKLSYELLLHRGEPVSIGSAYAERLTEATGFRYPEEDCLIDVDPGFYSARYLRAWQLESVLESSLTERFDSDWYRNPRAGVFLQHLMSRGQVDPADRLADSVARAELAFQPTLRLIEASLS